MKLTIDLGRDADMTEEPWISHCLELDVVSQGRTPQEAIEAVAEAVDMMVRDEIAELESSGQNSGWERAFSNIADEVSRREASLATDSMIVNLTPYPITVTLCRGKARTLSPSGVIARAIERRTAAETIDGLPTSHVEYDGVRDLPSPGPSSGRWYVVSMVTAQAAKQWGRGVSDLLVPGEQVHDTDGNVVGYKSLQRVQ